MNRLVLPLLVWILLVAGCQSSSKPDKGGFNPRVVDDLLSDAVAQMLEQRRKDGGEQGTPPLVAFVGVENKSAWIIGSNEESSYDVVDTAMVNSGLFTMISLRQVEEGKRVAGIQSVDEFFTPEPRRAFVKAVGENGLRPDYLMWAKFTSIDDQDGGSSSSSVYQLSLELVDSVSGQAIYKKLARRSR